MAEAAVAQAEGRPLSPELDTEVRRLKRVYWAADLALLIASLANGALLVFLVARGWPCARKTHHGPDKSSHAGASPQGD